MSYPISHVIPYISYHAIYLISYDISHMLCPTPYLIWYNLLSYVLIPKLNLISCILYLMSYILFPIALYLYLYYFLPFFFSIYLSLLVSFNFYLVDNGILYRCCLSLLSIFSHIIVFAYNFICNVFLPIIFSLQLLYLCPYVFS